MSRTISFVVALILIVGLYLVISTVVSVGAQEPEPVISQNAPDAGGDDMLCRKLGYMYELRVLGEHVQPGLTYLAQDGFAVTITDTQTMNDRITAIDWQVSVISEPSFGGVDATVWKGDLAFSDIHYDPEAMSGTHAGSVSSTCGLGLCYISFCYDTTPLALELVEWDVRPIYWAGWMLVGICVLAGLFVLAIFIPRRK
jgi:hypothetical protein